MGRVVSSSSKVTYWLACHFLSCSVPVVVTLLLPVCFTRVAFLRVTSREPLVRSSRENTLECTHALEFFTLSHTQPLHNSHLNTGYLIAELQEDLTRNKGNTWLNKFNFTILTCYFNKISSMFTYIRTCLCKTQ